MNKKVSIIIPVYNGKNYLEVLLPSVMDQDYDDYEVIIVDDTSTDKSIIPYIKENFPGIRVIQNTQNLGFPLSCNVGIRASNSPYICLLNSDTVLDKSYLRKHAEFLDEHPGVGILGCKIMDEDGKIQSSGVIFKDGHPLFFTDDTDKVRYVEHVDFVGAFIRREIFEKYGLLSPDYFMKFDDCDFCLRVSKESDYKMAILPEGLIKHFGRSNSMSPYDNIFYYCRNLLVLQKKYFPEEVKKSLVKRIPEVLLSRIKEGFKHPRTMPANIGMIFKGISGAVSGIKFKAGQSGDYKERL
ncbi:MAG: glycosyltransferase family 2 protein [Armatimonadota bacterium]